MTLDKRLPSSESWTDRNKAGSLLQSITATRDPKAPAELRSEGLAPLIEMDQWYDTPIRWNIGSFLVVLAGSKKRNYKRWR